MSSMNQEYGYWRSLGELEGSEGFQEALEREFPKDSKVPPDSVARRRFMQLMGASVALAGTAACRWKTTDIVPLTRHPDGYVPGESIVYRTAMDLGGVGLALSAISIDGRPIKIEGNVEHPFSMGGTDTYAQASILGLYDPDRSRAPKQGKKTLQVREVLQSFADLGQKVKDGHRLLVLAEADSSPTVARLQSGLRGLGTGVEWLEYEAISRDNFRAAARTLYGKDLRPHYDYRKARVVLALGADPLGGHLASIRWSRDWADARDPENARKSGSMLRMYAVEARMSHTGAAADHRLPLRPSQYGAFLAALASSLGVPGMKAASLSDANASGFLKALVRDLDANRESAFVHVGEDLPAELVQLGLRINHQLGSVGTVLRLTEEPDSGRGLHQDALASACARLEANEVDTLVILGGNPAYASPDADRFAKALDKVDSVHLGLYRDETGSLAKLHVPEKHFLERWGDVRSYDGTISVTQPLIDPLFDSVSKVELLAALLGNASPDARREVQTSFATREGLEPWWNQAWVRDAAKREVPPATAPSQRVWQKALDRGWVEGTAFVPVLVAAPSAAPAAAASESPPEGFELIVFEDGKTYDGRFANNGWLQETPEFLTKLTWDNAALLGVRAAKALGVTDEDVVRLTGEGVAVDLPVVVLPGITDGVVAVARGYGRRLAGYVGGDVGRDIPSPGVNVESLVGLASVKIAKTGAKKSLACTQEHNAIDNNGAKERERRAPELVRSGTLVDYIKNEKFAKERDHHPPLLSLFDTPQKEDQRKWAMTVDLNRCTGCNACSVACQSENNIPVVGKEQVKKGREMSWIRIDRYFRGSPENPEVAAQPVACAHCEHAPCEQVCPVAATVHSDEGLNDMVYNRCIGTRYCGNNCPYKVRRFNYHAYAQDALEPMGDLAELAMNPSVTIRFRGVMEKCTYCVQRISKAKHDARIEKREVRDGDVTPACAAACSTQAIVFGDANDPESRVSKKLGLGRAYALLAELNIRPRTQYLAKVRNPNPDLENL
jgi:MoCo/4Fe-4S cofactor protein with predicted Tat translocation signal